MTLQDDVGNDLLDTDGTTVLLEDGGVGLLPWFSPREIIVPTRCDRAPARASFDVLKPFASVALLSWFSPRELHWPTRYARAPLSVSGDSLGTILAGSGGTFYPDIGVLIQLPGPTGIEV